MFSPVRDTDHATRAHKTRRRQKGTCPLQISRFRIFSLHGLPASPPPCARPRSIRVQAARARVRPHTTTRNQRWRQHGRPEPPPSSSMLPHVRAIRHTPHATRPQHNSSSSLPVQANRSHARPALPDLRPPPMRRTEHRNELPARVAHTTRTESDREHPTNGARAREVCASEVRREAPHNLPRLT